MTPLGTATSATSERTVCAPGKAETKRLFPTQIATATPAMMQSAYKWIVKGPSSTAEVLGVGKACKVLIRALLQL